MPTGPELRFTDEVAPDPITLTVYAGADAQFRIYEDDGLTYDYEGGAFSRITIRWDDATRTLTLADREGSFAGMLETRTFDIILVEPSRPVGFSFTPQADTSVVYDGSAVSVTL